jgi:hypothetical protein
MKALFMALAASTALAFPAATTVLAQQSQPGQTQPQAGDQSISPQRMNKDQIRQIQQALKDKGLYRGEVDGIWGPNTASAMRQFGSKEGQTSGAQRGGMDRIDPNTLTALGLDPAQFRQGPSDRATPGAPSSPPRTSPGAPPSGTQPSSPGTSPGLKPDYNNSPSNTPGNNPGDSPSGPSGSSPSSPGPGPSR